MGSMNDLGAKPKPTIGKKKKDKVVKIKKDDDMKIADEINKIHEVIKGVSGEMTSVDMGHKHEYEMDESGNGMTISTLSAAGEGDDDLNEHVHEIVNGVIQESMGHSHSFSDEG
jgi:hypothetical protein